MLGRVGSLASDAAAVALNEKQPQRAVELLEQVRGILLAQLVRYQTALTGLEAAAPEMAAKFKELSIRLEHSVNRESTEGMEVERGMLGPDIVGRQVTFLCATKTMILTSRVLWGHY